MANFFSAFDDPGTDSNVAPAAETENAIQLMKPLTLRKRREPFNEAAYKLSIKDDMNAPGRKLPPLRAIFRPARCEQNILPKHALQRHLP